MDTHCLFGLRPIGLCTNWSFVRLDHVLIGHVHSPPKMNWIGLAYGQPAQLTPPPTQPRYFFAWNSYFKNLTKTFTREGVNKYIILSGLLIAMNIQIW